MIQGNFLLLCWHIWSNIQLILVKSFFPANRFQCSNITQITTWRKPSSLCLAVWLAYQVVSLCIDFSVTTVVRFFRAMKFTKTMQRTTWRPCMKRISTTLGKTACWLHFYFETFQIWSCHLFQKQHAIPLYPTNSPFSSANGVVGSTQHSTTCWSCWEWTLCVAFAAYPWNPSYFWTSWQPWFFQPRWYMLDTSSTWHSGWENLYLYWCWLCGASWLESKLLFSFYARAGTIGGGSLSSFLQGFQCFTSFCLFIPSGIWMTSLGALLA